MSEPVRGCLDLQIVVHAPVSAVWAALVSDELRRAWWSNLELDPRPGGRLIERWRDGTGRELTTVGQVLEAEPPHRLRCSWRDDDWRAATEVELHLRSEANRTCVHLRHLGWGLLGADGPRLRAAHDDGWRAHLTHLKAYVEREATGDVSRAATARATQAVWRAARC